jgi:hypothetical protein
MASSLLVRWLRGRDVRVRVEMKVPRSHGMAREKDYKSDNYDNKRNSI